MTSSHTDNEINEELIGTSRPSDSIETDREDFHQLYLLENREHIDTSPLETIKKTNTLDSPLADTQTVEVTIDRGTNIEYRSRNLTQNMIYQRNSHRHEF